MTWYGVLKVVHVLSVVIWIGAGAAFAMITARLVRARDRATLASFLPLIQKYMQSAAGPASLLVLLTGIAMVVVARIGFQPLWVSWGFAGIVVHFLFGALVMRKRMMALGQAVAVSPADENGVALAGARLRLANLIYLLVMTSVIVVMVLKPV